LTVYDNPAGAAIDASQLRSPITRAGYEYWRGKKGARPFPARADFDPLIEQPTLARNMVLVEVRHEPLDFRYRLIGSAVRANMKADWTGKWMSEIPMQRAPNPIWQHHLWVLEHKAPRFYRPANLGPNNVSRSIESAQLPLGPDGETIDMMMVFVDFVVKAVI
jgi:hypothetical protein